MDLSCFRIVDGHSNMAEPDAMSLSKHAVRRLTASGWPLDIGSHEERERYRLRRYNRLVIEREAVRRRSATKQWQRDVLLGSLSVAPEQAGHSEPATAQTQQYWSRRLENGIAIIESQLTSLDIQLQNLESQLYGLEPKQSLFNAWLPTDVMAMIFQLLVRWDDHSSVDTFQLHACYKLRVLLRSVCALWDSVLQGGEFSTLQFVGLHPGISSRSFEEWSSLPRSLALRRGVRPSCLVVMLSHDWFGRKYLFVDAFVSDLNRFIPQLFESCLQVSFVGCSDEKASVVYRLPRLSLRFPARDEILVQFPSVKHLRLEHVESAMPTSILLHFPNLVTLGVQQSVSIFGTSPDDPRNYACMRHLEEMHFYDFPNPAFTWDVEPLHKLVSRVEAPKLTHITLAYSIHANTITYYSNFLSNLTKFQLGPHWNGDLKQILRSVQPPMRELIVHGSLGSSKAGKEKMLCIGDLLQELASGKLTNLPHVVFQRCALRPRNLLAAMDTSLTRPSTATRTLVSFVECHLIGRQLKHVGDNYDYVERKMNSLNTGWTWVSPQTPERGQPFQAHRGTLGSRRAIKQDTDDGSTEEEPDETPESSDGDSRAERNWRRDSRAGPGSEMDDLTTREHDFPPVVSTAKDNPADVPERDERETSSNCSRDILKKPCSLYFGTNGEENVQGGEDAPPISPVFSEAQPADGNSDKAFHSSDTTEDADRYTSEKKPDTDEKKQDNEENKTEDSSTPVVQMHGSAVDEARTQLPRATSTGMEGKENAGLQSA